MYGCWAIVGMDIGRTQLSRRDREEWWWHGCWWWHAYDGGGGGDNYDVAFQ